MNKSRASVKKAPGEAEWWSIETSGKTERAGKNSTSEISYRSSLKWCSISLMHEIGHIYRTTARVAAAATTQKFCV